MEPQHLPLDQSYLEPVIFNLKIYITACRSTDLIKTIFIIYSYQPSLLQPASLKADLGRPSLLQQPPIKFE